MVVTTFTCKNCGANIDAPAESATVTCSYCGSRHRVSIQEGSVTAELIAKVKKLDEDVARLKGGQAPLKKTPTLGERLAMIAEGKRKWHEYYSSVKAGKGRNSPEMLTVFKDAQANLIEGYGSAYARLIEDAYGAKLVGLDPPGGYSCLFILLGIIIVSLVSGAVVFLEGNGKLGMILLAIGIAGVVAGVPFVIVGIRADKHDIEKRKDALQRLDEVEREIRRRLSAAGKRPS